MRILELDLERYGPFTGKRLVFRPDARLHVVFGPNEAGKTSSLSAVTDLLYGIESKTRADFIHTLRELRVGATVRTRSGETLSFRRRRHKPILTGPDEKPLADDVLSSMLGGVDRDVFQRAFGLDAEALRRSSEELRHTDGELGAALFSAASGLRGFSELQKTLTQEADRIFAERKSKDRLFYQAADRFETARKQLRDHELRAGELKRLREELDSHESTLQDVARKRGDLDGQIARVERLRRAAPIIRAIDGELQRAAALGTLPDAPAGLGEALLRHIEARAAAARSHGEAQDLTRRLEAELAAITLDPAALDRAKDIQTLIVRFGGHAKARSDLPVLERKEDEISRELKGLATRLGLPDIETLIARQPDDASIASVQAALDEGVKLHAALAACQMEHKRELAALEARRAQRSARVAILDPGPLREQMRSLDEIVAAAVRLEQQAPELAADTARLAEEAARLSPPVVDLDRLAESLLPSGDSIASFAKRFADCAAALAREADNLAQLDDEERSIQKRLAGLAEGGEVPTREAIAQLRDARDARWSGLRDMLFGKAGHPPRDELPSLVYAFEQTQRDADAMSDAAAGDAERIAAFADATARARDLAERRRAAEARREKIANAETALTLEWSRLWDGSGVAPLPPQAMAGWRIQIDSLLSRRAKLGERAILLNSLTTKIDDARPAFAALLARLSLEPMDGLGLVALAKRISSELDRLGQIWEEARSFETLVADLEKRIDSSRNDIAEGTTKIERWREDLRTVLPRIGLPADATEIEAQACMLAWREAPAQIVKLDEQRRRIKGIHRDAREFEADLSALVATIAPDLANEEAERALERLSERAKQARDANTKRGEAERRLAEESGKLADCAATLQACGREIEARLADAGLVSGDDDLPDLARRLAERDKVATALATRRDELANAADGQDEERLREALSHFDPETADDDIARLRAERETLEHSANQAYADRNLLSQKLKTAGADMEAEVALQQRRGAEAEMIEAARDWALLSIGARMVGAAVERQRVGSQEPLMLRAGELFAMLTGGAYQGLAQEYEDDAPHVEGRRADGKGIRVADMSEGTRDQLYLALRLAYVDDFARRAETPPFIADDLFASFDDERTAHGLRALAQVGDHLQPILFTHHRFVVDYAVRELGRQVDIVELAG